jgi:hypothetical protein
MERSNQIWTHPDMVGIKFLDLPNVLQEYHQQVLVVEKSLSEATQKVKSSAFYKDYNQPNGASSHIDDKYALDVDDAFAVEDILPLSQKRNLV